MAILEILVSTVGLAISKSILIRWLSDPDIVLTTSLQISGILSKKISEILIRRKTERQFEEISENVAENLLPIMNEYKIQDNDLEAVLIKAAHKIESIHLNPELLLSIDLDPTQLSEYYLVDYKNRTKSFSEPASQLYRRLIMESSNYITDICSNLPSFNEKTFSEVLKREREIISIANDILKLSKDLRKESQKSNKEKKSTEFEVEYRKTIIRKLDRQELFGVDLREVNKRHSLSLSYISLAVNQKLQSKEVELENSDDEESLEPLSLQVEEAIAKSKRMIIKGIAGSGKTTLLKWIAVHAAKNNFPNTLKCWNSKIPFFIPLRHFVEKGFPKPEEFPNSIASMITGSMPDGWVHDRLKTGNALLLIDSVDEVPENKREAVREWLIDLVDTFNKPTYMITSRPHAIKDEWLKKNEFEEAELQEMSLSDISNFITHWHAAIKDNFQKQDEKDVIDKLSENLKKEVRKNNSIQQLSTNPLLCALICALHRERNQEIPSDRIGLYEACISMLLHRRDNERKIRLKDYPELKPRQMTSLLQHLAYWMMNNNLSYVDIKRSEGQIDMIKVNMESKIQRSSSNSILRFFIERTSILREPILGSIDFTHRTFQEFFAAKAACNNDDIEFLIEKATNDQWREVIILSAGLLNNRSKEKLIKGLIQKGDKERHNKHQLHLLAVTCLETIVELNPKLRALVDSRLKKLVPPKNLTEAIALSSADELAIPYLVGCRNANARETAAIVRTLSLINGDLALEALENFVNDKRVTVIKELVKTIETFEEEKIFPKIISKLNFDNLLVEKTDVLANLSKIQHIRKLRVKVTKSTSHLDELVNFEDLEILELEISCDVTNLKCLLFLRSLVNLKTLIINGYYNYNNLDFELSSSMFNLTRLELHGFHGLKKISINGNLESLTSLELSDLGKLKYTSLLAGVLNLERITLYRLNKNIDLSNLCMLHKINTLELGNDISLKSLNKQIRVKNIIINRNYFWLQSTGNYLNIISKIADVKYISITHIQKVIDIKELLRFTELKKLHLVSQMEIVNFELIENFKKLEDLIVYGFWEYDFSFVLQLPNLKSLRTYPNNKLDDLKVQFKSKFGSDIKLY